MRTKYQGFTLVEMLIVMGILAVLMTIGIAVGRFALQRANNIAHTGAANQISQAVQAYYTDNRKYPGSLSTNYLTGSLVNYIETGFDGGSEASFYYDVDSNLQAYLVCVSLGGYDDSANLGFYCTGDGFSTAGVFNAVVTEKNNTHAILTTLQAYDTTPTSRAKWDGKKFL
ncbi:MAG: hypothetical protein Fur003_1150 [Candidatus Dojkabacteria bacterium]